MSETATDDVDGALGTVADRRYEARRTIGRTGVVAFALAPVDDLEAGPFEHPERAVEGVRGWDPIAARDSTG